MRVSVETGYEFASRQPESRTLRDWFFIAGNITRFGSRQNRRLESIAWAQAHKFGYRFLASHSGNWHLTAEQIRAVIS